MYEGYEIIEKHFLGMRVCVPKEATDKNILAFCNQERECGTSAGWCEVFREEDTPSSPIPCDNDPSKVHLVVYC
jgi:hypothetical protein